MNVKSTLFSLLLLGFLFSCSEGEVCPEHEDTFHCNSFEFIGTWEFVGYDFEIEEHTCLSSLEVEIDPERDIILESPTESVGNFSFGSKHFKIRKDSGCRASETSTEFFTLGDLVFGDTEFLLVNPNYLIVSSRILATTSKRIYRRKK